MDMYKKLYVILDNGHGINTPGKCSPSKSLKEWEYNRDIVTRIKNVLTQLGIQYRILVPETKDISLTTRVKRANNIYNELKQKGYHTILISVHVNAAGNGAWEKATGWSAYTSKGKTKGDVLANAIYDAATKILTPLNKKIRTDWSDKDPDYEENFTIITKTICPAVLTENFFMDSKTDCEWLLTEKGRQTIADIHIHGILNYIDIISK